MDIIDLLVKKNGDLEHMLDSSVDQKNRTIYFHNDVDEESVADLIKQLNYLDSYVCAEPEDKITLNICSYGGSVDHMFAAYDAIQQLEHDVITVGTGAVCSAASLIIACGAERAATENSWVMVHKGKGMAAGDEDEIQAQAFLFKKQEQLYYNLMARHTKLTAKEWRDMINKKGEGWFGPTEMLKYGLVDKIIKPKRAIKKRASRKKTPIKKV